MFTILRKMGQLYTGIKGIFLKYDIFILPSLFILFTYIYHMGYFINIRYILIHLVVIVTAQVREINSNYSAAYLAEGNPQTQKKNQRYCPRSQLVGQEIKQMLPNFIQFCSSKLLSITNPNSLVEPSKLAFVLCFSLYCLSLHHFTPSLLPSFPFFLHLWTIECTLDVRLLGLSKYTTSVKLCVSLSQEVCYENSRVNLISHYHVKQTF